VAKNKPLPKDHPLHHASKELIAAVDFYEKLIAHHMGDFASFESAWREFLQKIERVWNKTQAAMAGRKRWAKLESEIAHQRNTDPLLVYLRHARNADEHSIQPIATEWDAKLRTTSNRRGYSEGVGCLDGVDPYALGYVPVEDGVNHPSDRHAS